MSSPSSPPSPAPFPAAPPTPSALRLRWSVWLARIVPGLLLVVTLVDDPIFGSVIVATRLAFGIFGLLMASTAFVLLSVAMAAATAWALRTEPLRLSPRNRERLTSLRNKRLGRFLIPHPERLATTATAAVIFGSVAPIMVAALGTEGDAPFTTRMVIVAGIAYGLAFAASYGLLGALIGTAT